VGARSFFHAGEVWVAYRQRSGSILGSLTPPKLNDWVAALVEGTTALRELDVDLSEATRAAIADYCARTSMTIGALAATFPAADVEELRSRHVALWRSAWPWPALRVERAYWLAGRFKQALRWRRWRRRAGL
jgi:hypothetical protein